MAQAGFSTVEIARRFSRHRSTVHRELARGGGPVSYRAGDAHKSACERKRRPKVAKLARDAELAAAVAERLAWRWSPGAISADLRSQGMAVSAETIYQGCYDLAGRRGLAPNSWRQLPRQRCRRKPRSRCEQAKRSVLGEFRPLADRPPAVDGRAEPGHWEGDLIIGKANASAVATLVERTSRHTLAVPLLNGYDAASTATAVSAALMRQPRHLLKTLTWDQGREMARWPDIEQNTGIKVYFCEPRSPWQRPTNEQTNGLLRRWLPKGTNLNIGAVRLALIQDSINLMPRKLHDWNSAHSVYTELCRNDR